MQAFLPGVQLAARGRLFGFWGELGFNLSAELIIRFITRKDPVDIYSQLKATASKNAIPEIGETGPLDQRNSPKNFDLSRLSTCKRLTSP